MALKDWKKKINSQWNIRFYNKKTGAIIEILASMILEKTWFVNIYDSKIIRKKYESKTNAFKFTKEYMTKH